MSRFTAFLVEDNPILRGAITEMLHEDSPVSVVGHAADEGAAMSWLTDPGNHCDLLIIDVFLDSGSGLGVLQSARDAAAGGTLVVLTNYATPALRQGCLRLGADRVFDKSTEIEEFVAYCVQLAAGPPH